MMPISPAGTMLGFSAATPASPQETPDQKKKRLQAVEAQKQKLSAAGSMLFQHYGAALGSSDGYGSLT